MGYSHAEALKHVLLAAAAYCDPKAIETWSCPPCTRAAAALGVPRLDVTAVVNGNQSALQAFVARADDRVYVAFRGSAAWLNFYLDVDEYRSVAYGGAACEGCLVHDGFIYAWQDVNTSVVGAVRKALAATPRGELVVVGHSLGGAVAVLAALELHAAIGRPLAAVYTFGEPRVGNANFAQQYRSRAKLWPTWRVTHAHDIVPHLPPRNWLVPYVLTYEHHTREVWYDNYTDSTHHIVCNGTNGEDFACADSVWVYQLSVSDHLHYLDQPVSSYACSAAGAPGRMAMPLMTTSARRRARALMPGPPAGAVGGPRVTTTR